MESILTSIKKLLGVQEEDINFDPDITMHINSVFFILNQLGVGNISGFSIIDKVKVWTDYIPDDANLNVVKSYMYLKVKLLFDPPLSNALIEIIKTQIAELEFRIMITVDPKPIVTPIIVNDEEVLTW